MSAKIQKWGNSQGIRIPKNILSMMSWDIDQEVELIPDLENGKLILAKVDNNNNYLEKLFEDFDGVYQTEEFDWGDPQGDEVWKNKVTLLKLASTQRWVMSKVAGIRR